jgi:hypothetical protein
MTETYLEDDFHEVMERNQEYDPRILEIQMNKEANKKGISILEFLQEIPLIVKEFENHNYNEVIHLGEQLWIEIEFHEDYVHSYTKIRTL